jgi:hypothetical protein
MSVKPMGALNLLASLVILGGVSIKKKLVKPKRGRPKKKRERKVLIISLIMLIFICIYLTYSIIKNPLIKESIILEEQNFYKCEIKYNQIAEKNIIIRIDDIQANYYSDIQKRMIDTLREKEITAVLGVIPMNLVDDKIITKLLLRNKCNLEIALHGYNHKNAEFQNLTYSESIIKLNKGLEVLNYFNKEIITFIPPENLYSDESKRAILDKGFLVISDEYGGTNESSTYTYNWINNSIVSLDLIKKECGFKFNKSGICVIIVHPQDYITNNKIDEDKYNQFTSLLDWIKEENINTINYRDLQKR